MIPEHLVKKYNYTYVQSCNLLNEPFVKDLLKENEKLKKELEVGEEQYNDLVEEKEKLEEQLSSITLQLAELKKELKEKDILIKQCDLSVSNVMDCYCERTDCSGRIKDSKQYNSLVQKVENQQQEFIKYLEKEKDRLARECSHIYEDSLGKTKLVNEDIFDEVDKNLQKYKEIIGEK